MTEYRDSADGAYVCFGVPSHTVAVSDTVTVAAFPAGSLIVYVRYISRQACAWVFRCVADGHADIPGVSVRVDLLATAPTRGKVTRLKRVLDTLHAWKIDLNTLTDGFYLRLNALLHSRDFRIGQLKRILSHEKV